MSYRDKFEDDGRTIADMSGVESPGLFGRRSRSSQTGRTDIYANNNEKDSAEERKPWEDAPFTWMERVHYIGMALGAALSIAFVLLAGIALIIWLITLYA